MDLQIIHKEGNWFVPDLLSKLFDVVAEIFTCAGLIMDFYKSNALWIRHGCDHRAITDIDILLINCEIRIFTGPLSEFEGSLRKVNLIDEDYQAAFSFGLFYLLY